MTLISFDFKLTRFNAFPEILLFIRRRKWKGCIKKPHQSYQTDWVITT